MHPFEPQFSLQGAFHGKLAPSVFQMGHAKQLTKPICLLEGDNWCNEILSTKMATTTKTIESIENDG